MTANNQPEYRKRIYSRGRYGDLTHGQAFKRTPLPQVLLASDFSRVTFFEDPTIPSRLGRTLRWLKWKLVRLPTLIWLITKSDRDGKNAILSQNLLAVAKK